MSNHITVIDLDRVRGDDFPIQFTLNDEAGSPVPITSFTFLMTADAAPDPSDALANLWELTGVIVDAPNGVFEFRPTIGQMDQLPSTYFYDVQMIDAGGFKRTIIKGELRIEQDITKT